jgi:hypothetical protein
MSNIPPTQKAVWISNPGPNGTVQLRTIPTPQPGDGEVLVKIEYSGIWYILSTKHTVMFFLTLILMFMRINAAAQTSATCTASANILLYLATKALAQSSSSDPTPQLIFCIRA